jgi:Glycosyl hydrolases family 2, sugar binding domain/Glycosyl hydrolases family 2, TIM barrel domain/Glycosyl hydrolases family 2
MILAHPRSNSRTGRALAQVLLPLLLSVTPALAAVSFPHVFSPQTGLTAPVEQPWRQELCLNGSWQFQPIALPANYDLKNGTPQLPEPLDKDWSATPIRIPSPWNINAFGLGGFVARTFPSYPAEWEKARMGWLRRTFKVPANWNDKCLVLHFEAVSGSVQVFVNGKQVAEHFDNSLPFSVDVTDFVEREGNNTLLLGIRQASLFDVPGMFGKHTYPAGSNWTLQMIGIWQDVYLRALPAVRVDEIAVRPLVDQGILELSVTVRNNTAVEQTFRLGGRIQPWISAAGTEMLSAPVPKGSLGDQVADVAAIEGRVGPRMTTTLVLRRSIKDELKFWTPESPNLYGLVLDLQQNGNIEDRFYQRFGWRQWGIAGRDVTLNGKPYQLRADSGHLLGVSYMTRRYAWSWYKALKDVNGNAVRLHAIVRPRFYLELADEMGIAILDESDIWASSMEINYHAPETWQRFHDHIDGLVLRDRNHASVFGWSIANEILSALWWKGIPRKFWPPVIDHVVALADLVRALDPTRPWISSDGDGDFHGKLPTYIYHYGKPQDWHRQAPKDKPFGIGEGGSMIWGSPVVFSAQNGERSYESRLGMQEGTAIEIYGYLVEQRKMSAFCSVFTIAGSCFQSLQLGVTNPKGRPSPDDGIVFGPFVEGQPGMQPERMPAWGTNFNPGYDPSQPFYITTPVFEAVKAAYAPDGPLPCPWDHKIQSPPRPEPPPATIKQVAFIGDTEGALKKALVSSGVPVDLNAAADSEFLVVDGATLDGTRLADARGRLQQTLARHGTVFVWVAPENVTNVNTLLPAAISLTSQNASALFADRKAPETAPLALADLYFQDQSDKVILKHGLAGPLVKQSRTLVETNSFGRRWFMDNDEGRSPALIASETDGGRLIVTSLAPDIRSARRLKLMRSLHANLGVALREPSNAYDNGFDGAGYLNQALVLGSFQGTLYPEILDRDFIGHESEVNPSPGEKVGDREWQYTSALGDGLFDFFRLGLAGTEGNRARAQGPVLKPEALDANNYLEVVERVSGTNPGTNSVVYVSFWVQSPRAVEASKLNFVMVSDDGAKIWVNSRQIFEERKIYGPGMTDPKKVPLALNAGWNHVLVKIGQLDGPWTFSARFESEETALIAQLRASATGQ